MTHSNDTLVLAMANLGGATETEMILWIINIGDVISAKMSAIATEYVLALATLGDAAKNRNYPIFCRAAWQLSL
jgi:hypothetical protein